MEIIASTTFLYKIDPSVNQQKPSNQHQMCFICNKNNKLVFNPSMENTLIVLVKISDPFSEYVRHPYATKNPTLVFCTYRLNTHLFLL